VIKIVFVFVCLFLYSCGKNEPQTLTISYKIEETTTATPAYTVTYSTETATQTEGPITSTNWASPSIKKLVGEVATLTLDGGSGIGSFFMRIYVSGVLVKEETMDNPFGPKTISVIVE
jgi:hypothetical protein